MKLGMIGLGRMGLNMVKRLLQGGQEVVEDSREGRWTALQAIESGVAATCRHPTRQALRALKTGVNGRYEPKEHFCSR